MGGRNSNATPAQSPVVGCYNTKTQQYHYKTQTNGLEI